MKVRAYGEPQRSYRILIHLTRIPWFVQQAFRHLKHGELTAITGYPGYLLWKAGALRMLKLIFVRKLALPAAKVAQTREGRANFG